MFVGFVKSRGVVSGFGGLYSEFGDLGFDHSLLSCINSRVGIVPCQLGKKFWDLGCIQGCCFLVSRDLLDFVVLFRSFGGLYLEFGNLGFGSFLLFFWHRILSDFFDFQIDHWILGGFPKFWDLGCVLWDLGCVRVCCLGTSIFGALWDVLDFGLII